MVSSRLEPEWDDEQRELVQAARIVEANTGPNGEWMPDATNDDLSDPMAYSGQRPKVEGPFTNWYEKARLDAIEEHRKSLGDNPNMNGVYFTVKKFELPKP